MSNAGQRVKFGLKRIHNWPVISYEMYIRAGPHFILYLLIQSKFLVCLYYLDLVVPDSVFK